MQSALPLFDAALRVGGGNSWALTGRSVARCGALGRRCTGELLLRRLSENVRGFVPDWLGGHISMKGARSEYREETLPYPRLAGWHDALWPSPFPLSEREPQEI